MSPRIYTYLPLTSILLLVLLSACGGKEIDPSLIEERCTDGVDNNGDGLVDCEDPTCSQFASCSGNEHCYNGVDDNGDGLIDCEDDTCQGLFICQTDIEDCSNGKDDDGDGAVDCQDTACQNTNICKPGAEHCSNGVDDDGDSLIDCDDPDCSSVFFCLAKFEIPGNSIDDDGDGATDCDDPELAMTSDCLESGEVCNNGKDDDGDGLADCLDNDCANTSTCLFPAEVCNNGVDDDGDGDTDCADSSCTGSFYCADEICNDGVDNDGDGLVDCDDSEECPATLYNCLKSLEVCDDDIDNDLDGLIDCEDDACTDDPACEGALLEVCGNNIDDDNDGLTDCEDLDDCGGDALCTCALNADNEPLDCSAESCQNLPWCICQANLREDPVHGNVPDCSLSACSMTSDSCKTGLTQELCAGDMIDNDGDTFIDCDDLDCSGVGECPTLECPTIASALDGSQIPDCTNIICQQTAPECKVDPSMPELCNNDGIDNDDDGLIDCADVDDCGTAPECQCPVDAQGTPLDCADPRCGATDYCQCLPTLQPNLPWADKPDCSLDACKAVYPGCREGEPAEICDGFGVDNDQQNGAECDDPACGAESACQCPVDAQGTPLDCSNPLCTGLDYCACEATKVANGAIDCSTNACQNTYQGCRTGIPEVCDDLGVDNDADGFTDCDDFDCSDEGLCPPLMCPTITHALSGNQVADCTNSICQQSAPECQTGLTTETYCDGDGIDNDGDGLIDCADDDCDVAYCMCPLNIDDGLPLDCSDTRCVDEDHCLCEDFRTQNPGAPFCNESFCANAPECQTGFTTETYCDGDGTDNDGDGFTDCDDLDCSGVGSCPVVSCPMTETYYELTNLPDCSDIYCQQSQVECQTGHTQEYCNGDGIDNDGALGADCNDAECAANAPICQCPVDGSGLPLDCSDDRCAGEDFCQCLALSTPQPTAPPGTTTIDCTLSVCQTSAPECQTGLTTETYCDGDGIDNDGDGLIDCEDPDCHEFTNNNAYCTVALCGDPQNNYQVVEVNTAITGEDITVSTETEMSALSPDMNGSATLLRGNLSIIGAQVPFNVPTTRLRCILPGGGGTTGTLLVEERSIMGMSRTGFNSLQVVQNLAFDAQAAGQEFDGFNQLMHVLGTLTINEPLYFDENDAVFGFLGLTALKRVGSDIVFTPHDGNLNNQALPFDFEGTTFSFTDLTQLVEVAGHFVRTPATDTNQFPPVYIHSGDGCSWDVQGNDESIAGSAVGGYFVTQSLVGLDHLRRIGGDLCFNFKPGTRDFNGLNRLEHIGGTLGLSKGTYYFGPSVDLSFNGLQNLQSIDEDFFVLTGTGSAGFDAYLFTDYSGLDALTHVGGDFFTGINSNFNNYTGLSALESVGGQFALYSEFGNTTHDPFVFQALNNLHTIQGRLLLYYTNAADLIGLNGLTTLGGIEFFGNDSLTNVDALGNITQLSQGSFRLNYNSNLTSYAGLNQITHVSEDVQFSTLQDYQNLTAIEHIGGNLIADYLSGFVDFTSFTNLQHIGGLKASGCSDLASFDGLPAMTTFTGDLIIEYTPVPASLPQFSMLQHVQGDLSLVNNFTDLSDFGNLLTVGGDLYLSSNPNLFTLHGFHHITSVGGNLEIRSNSMLNALNFDALTTVGKDFYIDSATELQTLDGLQNLVQVQGDFRISYTPLLTLSDLASLTHVGGFSLISSQVSDLTGLEQITGSLNWLELNANPNITDITALSGVTEVVEYFSLSTNNSLTTLNGLQNITGLYGTIIVNGNGSLSDISALMNITGVATSSGGFTMTNNTSLCQTDVDNFYNLLISHGYMGYANYQQGNSSACP